jgi:hypothetical protein
MRKFARFWPGFLVVLLIGAIGWAVGGSKSFQACIESESQRANQTKDQGSSVLSVPIIYRDCLGHFVTENDPAITAISTFVIAIFTLVLAGITDRQARLTKEALIADKRAFVYADGCSPLWEIDPATKQYHWRFRPNWHNSGDTPTKHMRMHVECELRNSPMPRGFDFKRVFTNIGTGLLPPRTGSPGGLAPMPPNAAITPQDLLDAQQGRKFIYFWGWVKYFDVFPGTPEHVTRFCWVFTPVGDPMAYVPGTAGQPPTPGTLSFPYVHHTEGNSADED